MKKAIKNTLKLLTLIILCSILNLAYANLNDEGYNLYITVKNGTSRGHTIQVEPIDIASCVLPGTFGQTLQIPPGKSETRYIHILNTGTCKGSHGMWWRRIGEIGISDSHADVFFSKGEEELYSHAYDPEGVVTQKISKQDPYHYILNVVNK